MVLMRTLAAVRRRSPIGGVPCLAPTIRVAGRLRASIRGGGAGAAPVGAGPGGGRWSRSRRRRWQRSNRHRNIRNRFRHDAGD